MRARAALVIHREDNDERHEIEARRHQEGAPQSDELRDRAADDRSERRADPLRGLHRADRKRHPTSRRGVRRHRQRERAVAGKQPLKRAQGEDVPRLRDKTHRRHDDDEAGERALDHDLAADAIGKPAPQRRHQCGDGRRDAKAHAGPQRDLADVGDAELTEVEREKRHHQREAGEADERRRGDGEEILAPGQSASYLRARTARVLRVPARRGSCR